MFVSIAPAVLVPVLCFISGTVLHVLASATSKWTKVDDGSRRIEYSHGLFRECFDDRCKDIQKDDFRYDWEMLQLIKAFALIGCIIAVLLSLVSMVSLFLLTSSRLTYKVKKIVVLSIILLGLSAGTCILVAVILHAASLFPDEADDDAYFHNYSHLGTSFVFSASGLVLLVLGVCIFAMGAHCLLRDHQKRMAYRNDENDVQTTSVKGNPPPVFVVAN